MNTLPKVIVKTDTRNEIRIFNSFLSDPNFPVEKQEILHVFPEIKHYLARLKTEKRAVENFINDFYSKHSKKIHHVIRDEKILLRRNMRKALTALGMMMQYRWPGGVTYTAIPTILPFSPFNKRTYYFSILERLFGNSGTNIVQISVHEISHFIFFDYLKKIQRQEGFFLDHDAVYYFKEALTTVLLNEQPMKRVLCLKKVDYGNPEIRDIRTQVRNGKTQSLVSYVQILYHKYKRENKTFENFLTQLAKTMHDKEKIFSKKCKFWNTYGHKIFENRRLLEKYRTPVRLS